jgi:hypothetical protein
VAIDSSLAGRIIAIPKPAGRVYSFGAIDSADCKIDFGVDSGWLLAFLNDSAFVKIDHYMLGASVYNGIYVIKADTLFLHFDSTYIAHSENFEETRANPKGKTYVISMVEKNEVKRYASPTLKLIAKKCADEKVYLSACDTTLMYMNDAFPDSLPAQNYLKKYYKDVLKWVEEK